MNAGARPSDPIVKELVVEPAGGRSFRGRLRAPGDKSISHRALLIAARAEGRSRVRGLSNGEDVRHTLGAVVALGARVERAGDELYVDGGVGRLHEPDAPPGRRQLGHRYPPPGRVRVRYRRAHPPAGRLFHRQAAHGPGRRTAPSDGRAGRRPPGRPVPATGGAGRAPGGHRLHPPGGQRPGEVGRPVRRPGG